MQFLTGKYQNNKEELGRFDNEEMYRKRYEDIANAESVKLFVDFAKQNKYSTASLAVAWARSHPAISAAIVGARNTQQLRTVLKSIDILMTQELRGVISGFAKSPAPANDRSEEKY